MAVTTTTFDSLLSGLSSETTNSIEIIMRNTSTGVSKKMSFATFAALLYAWITSNKASDLASVLGVGDVVGKSYFSSESAFFTFAQDKIVATGLIDHYGAIISICCYSGWYILVRRDTAGNMALGQSSDGLSTVAWVSL